MHNKHHPCLLRQLVSNYSSEDILQILIPAERRSMTLAENSRRLLILLTNSFYRFMNDNSVPLL